MVAKTIELPNIKKLFIPDYGNILCDTDLKQADAQVVAWEAHDDILKEIFRKGIDLHSANAEILNVPRQDAKAGVHLTNYGGSARTLAKAIGCTVLAAEDFQRRWFGEHPGIKDWHERVADSLATNRSVSNVFGYKNTYFDRVEGLLPEALAWIPQSTVAIVISKAMNEINDYYPALEMRAQVHDSIVVEFGNKNMREALIIIHRAMTKTCPYEDPLIIGADADVSSKSWGDCKRVDWPIDLGQDFPNLRTPEALREATWI